MHEQLAALSQAPVNKPKKKKEKKEKEKKKKDKEKEKEKEKEKHKVKAEEEKKAKVALPAKQAQQKKAPAKKANSTTTAGRWAPDLLGLQEPSAQRAMGAHVAAVLGLGALCLGHLETRVMGAGRQRA